ncbi:MAG: hypothetical protein KDA22_06635 [Phycisphaerales bacterium]|nr:hypothetical protein [Phycisphaerales bacterium]
MLSRRSILLAIACLLSGAGAVMLWFAARGAWLMLLAATFAATASLLPFGVRRATRLVEPEDIHLLEATRLRELIRGTSLHLRDMKYRYSVRPDPGSRMCFTAAVNQVRLGFVPVVITDNYTDKQGLGFVAFPYDGRRWRGPGLPCAGSREDALQHAARCVEPLGDLEDSRE